MLNNLIQGARISAVWTDYTSKAHRGKDNIKNPVFFKHFQRTVTGSTICSVTRRGKNVILQLDNGISVIIHMKMTGHLLVGHYYRSGALWKAEVTGPLSEPINQFIHLVFSFSNGTSLVLSDVRKFAKVTCTKTSLLHEHPDIAKLGPDPSSPHFTFTHFKERLLHQSHKTIKITLMDQEVYSGIGNIYADEILWKAGVHPLSLIGSLPLNTLRDLYKATKFLLQKGVRLGGDSTSDYRNPLGEAGHFHYAHKAYQNTGKPCTKHGCSGNIQRIVLRGRGTHFCTIHQKLFTAVFSNPRMSIN
jgi:formamidopyrimidine-DNA glycosylase